MHICDTRPSPLRFAQREGDARLSQLSRSHSHG
jgi:hypothetical protein